MNPNPTVIIVSKIAHAVRERTTWQKFVTQYGEFLTMQEITELYEVLMRDGSVNHEDLLIVDATPNEAEVAQFVVSKRRELGVYQLTAFCCTDSFSRDVTWMVHAAGTREHQSGKTIAEAVAKLPTAETIAAQKREAAAKLLAEAEALTAQQAA